MSLHGKVLAFALAAGVGLSGCAEREILLPGPREDLRAPIDQAVAAALRSTARPLDPGPAVAQANWTHLNGSPAHLTRHPALSASLRPLWSVSIGAGNDRKHRITADPVVADGRIFTLDSRARVTATGTNGALLWSRDLTPPADGSDDASGGGLAVAGGTLFVTSAFGTLTALDAATGAERWVHDFDAAATGAPTAVGGKVYVVTRNQIGWALDGATGRVLWQVLGRPSPSGIAGGPAPAVEGSSVVFPFGSAQMIATTAETGDAVWSASVAGRRLGRAFSTISDLTGDPVLAGDVVYAGNHAGRAGAFDRTTGQQFWSAEEGTIGHLWLAGGSLFFVSDENQLVRLDASTGETIWAVDLPFFTKSRLRARRGTFTQYGPVLAGGRLLVPSDDGLLRQFDPVSGVLIAATPMGDGAASNPVVAGGVLYLVTEDGTLRAYR